MKMTEVQRTGRTAAAGLDALTKQTEAAAAVAKMLQAIKNQPNSPKVRVARQMAKAILAGVDQVWAQRTNRLLDTTSINTLQQTAKSFAVASHESWNVAQAQIAAYARTLPSQTVWIEGDAFADRPGPIERGETSTGSSGWVQKVPWAGMGSDSERKLLDNLVGHAEAQQRPCAISTTDGVYFAEPGDNAARVLSRYRHHRIAASRAAFDLQLANMTVEALAKRATARAAIEANANAPIRSLRDILAEIATNKMWGFAGDGMRRLEHPKEIELFARHCFDVAPTMLQHGPIAFHEGSGPFIRAPKGPDDRSFNIEARRELLAKMLSSAETRLCADGTATYWLKAVAELEALPQAELAKPGAPLPSLARPWPTILSELRTASDHASYVDAGLHELKLPDEIKLFARHLFDSFALPTETKPGKTPKSRAQARLELTYALENAVSEASDGLDRPKGDWLDWMSAVHELRHLPRADFEAPASA